METRLAQSCMLKRAEALRTEINSAPAVKSIELPPEPTPPVAVKESQHWYMRHQNSSDANLMSHSCQRHVIGGTAVNFLLRQP